MRKVAMYSKSSCLMRVLITQLSETHDPLRLVVVLHRVLVRAELVVNLLRCICIPVPDTLKENTSEPNPKYVFERLSRMSNPFPLISKRPPPP